MRTHILMWMFTAILVCSIGCYTRKECELPPLDPGNAYPAASDNLHADIYLDATLSMKGFIVPGSSTYYQQTIPLLESSVEKGWPGGTVTFNKFGTRISPLDGRIFLDAGRVNFYTDSEVNLKTHIENVIESANTDNLTLIVTDLFQDNVDVNLLTSRIKTKYVTKSLGVGVMSIRSEFDGTVYDVGPNNYSFSYKSNDEDPSTFRPFYILALGRHVDIERYFSVLSQSGLERFSEKHVLIFSRYLTANIPSFNDASEITSIKLAQVRSLLPLDTKDGRVIQFRIRGTPPAASFAATFKYSGLPYTLQAGSPNLLSEVGAFHCRPKPKGEDNSNRPPDTLIESSEAGRALKVTKATLSGTELRLEAEVTPSLLPEDATYCYKVVLRPQEYQLPNWISDWDMDDKKVEEWKREPASFNGSLTYNLKHFLTNLWATTLEVHKPKVAEVYCYIQRG
jgi:hypothetical protein